MTDVLSSDGPSQFMQFSDHSEPASHLCIPGGIPGSGAAVVAATLAAKYGNQRRTRGAAPVRKTSILDAARAQRRIAQRGQTAGLRLPAQRLSLGRRVSVAQESSPRAFTPRAFTPRAFTPRAVDLSVPSVKVYVVDSDQGSATDASLDAKFGSPCMALASEPPEPVCSAGIDGTPQGAAHRGSPSRGGAELAVEAGHAANPLSSDFWLRADDDCNWLNFYLGGAPPNIARFREYSDLFLEDGGLLPIPSALCDEDELTPI